MTTAHGERPAGPDPAHERTLRIQIRVTPAERAEIERRATAEHRTVSEYVRWRAISD